MLYPATSQIFVFSNRRLSFFMLFALFFLSPIATTESYETSLEHAYSFIIKDVLNIKTIPYLINSISKKTLLKYFLFQNLGLLFLQVHDFFIKIST